MRILHTSDWHLGKRLFKLDRSAEHEAFLNWLVSTLIDREIDVLLIAGDVFDTPTPPHQALEMFYSFLHRVSRETKTDTYIIAGNHDSGLLLEAPRKLLDLHRVRVWGKLSQNPEDHWVTLRKGEEEVDLCAIPFFRSHELLPQGEGDAIEALKRYFPEKKKNPMLLMLHHLAGMFEAAGSEHLISLSGVDSIPNKVLSDFDYVALGHIHKPQRISDRAYYSGSPIPMRFSETQSKSVVLLEGRDLTPELLPIPISRQLVSVKAGEDDFREKINAISTCSELTPMVEVELTLKAPRMGLIDEVKLTLEKKGLELLAYSVHYQGEEKKERRSSKLFQLSTGELFQEYYASKFPQDPQVPAELLEDFTALLEKAKHASSPT